MVVTGESTSRLSELRKYTNSGDFFNKYFLSTGSSIDGVDKNLSDISQTPQKITYYIGGITYVDIISGTLITSEEDNGYYGYYTIFNSPIGIQNLSINDTVKTTFSFEIQGINMDNFVNKSIIKDPNKMNIIQKPKIDSDVFIDRQEISAFEKNFKLREIFTLNELMTYAGGRYFNVVDNS